MPPRQPVEAFTVPLAGRKLTPAKWRKIEQHLDAWKAEVLAAARAHPARSYRLGVAQIEAFAQLLGNLNTTIPQLANFGGVAPTTRAAAAWAREYTLRELNDALDTYIGRIKDALLYGLRGAANPTAIASMLYNATKDASVNWRAIARTEMARANAMGRLAAIDAMGYDRVWAPPHMGSCRACKRLLENQVFDLADVRDATNYGRAQRDWTACIPLHPHCRHGWLPYEPEVYAAMQDQYRELADAGLDEAALDELFDSSGQLKPGAEQDPRMAAWLEQTLKACDPYAAMLGGAIEQTVTKALGDRTWAREQLDVVHVARGLHQRPVNPDKVLAMAAVLRRGGQLPPIEVRSGFNGELWVVNGQHRVWAHRLAGRRTVDAWVKPAHDRTPLGDEAREVMAKVLTNDVAIDPRDLEPGPGVGGPVYKATLDGQLITAEPETAEDLDERPPDPLLFDGHRLRPDVALALEQWWQHATMDPGWEAWSRIYVRAHDRRPLIVVDYDALRAHRPEYRDLADVDLHLALVAATIAASRARELAPGIAAAPLLLPEHVAHAPLGATGPMWDLRDQTWYGPRPAGEPEQLERSLPDYTWAPSAAFDVELRLADRLVDEDDIAKRDVEDEPREDNGRWTNDEHALRFHPGPRARRDEAWGRGLVLPDGAVHTWPEDDEITHDHKSRLLGVAPAKAGKFIVRHDGWAKFYGHATTGRHVDRALHADPRLWTTESSHRMIGKLAVKANAANVGVEHWITIHPHGDEEKGQPVLVRNNGDGTMTVIGGAGGNLNMMRLDPSRRVDRDEQGKSKGAHGGSKVEQSVTGAEAESKQREREQQIAAARERLAQVQEARQQRVGELHDYLREHLGLDLDDGELDGRARAKLMKKLRT
jgi:hypothetical protein